MTKAEFVRRMLKAVEVAKQKGAVLNTQAVIAQAALETGWGNSDLAVFHNNVFGIKLGKDWTGPYHEKKSFEVVGGRRVPVPSKFRSYPSWNECLVDYSRIICGRKWYQDALPHADPPDGDGDAWEWVFHLVDKDYEGELRWSTEGLNYMNLVMGRAAVEVARVRGEIA